jgi:hypothetical protein
MKAKQRSGLLTKFSGRLSQAGGVLTFHSQMRILRALFDLTPGGNMSALFRSAFVASSWAMFIAAHVYAQDSALQQAIQNHVARQGPVTEPPRTQMAELDRGGSAEAVVSYCINENAAGGRNAGANNPANLSCAVTVFAQKTGQWVSVGQARLGQGKVRDVKGGVIHVESVTFGPNDPLCCPSRKVTQRLGLKNGKLVRLK